MADIERKLVKWSKRGVFSRRLRAKNEKKTTATRKSDLGKILRVFNVHSAIRVKTSANFPPQERTCNEDT